MKKNIFCLESLWNINIEQKLSVLPVLELTAKLQDINFIHLTCNTLTEFEYNIKLVSRKKSYKILYLAFHGNSQCIFFADGYSLDLVELAEIMKHKFHDWIIHFGSCKTLKANDSVLQQFVDATGVDLITGYTKEVYWAESAALEILLLRYMQKYKNVRYLQKYMEKTFPDLIKVNGFRFFHKG